MPAIQFMYVSNVVSRAKTAYKQELAFYLQVENLAYDKDIAVHWTDQQGEQHQVAAKFQHTLPGELEAWCAKVVVQGHAPELLPGDIDFIFCYRALQQEFWAQPESGFFHSSANSGITLAPELESLNLSFDPQIHRQQRLLPINIAVKHSVAAKAVIIHWTTNNWRSSVQTVCRTPKVRITRKPPATQLWSANLDIEQVFHLQYCICIETEDGNIWDNYSGHNFVAQRKPLSIMILNLHCYQEDNQDAKFSQIAKAIDDYDVDIICFQEVAELWNDGHGDWDSNSANIINHRLRKAYHLFTDWSHLGFNKYREGVALLSRYPFSQVDARYVSNSHDPFDIHSRKVVRAEIEYPAIGRLNIFSAHLSWWEDGFFEQYQNLSLWAAESRTEECKATLLCGDFNIAAGSRGYQHVVQANEYEDQFLAANASGLFDRIFRVNDPHWQQSLEQDHRIDYIFMHKSSELKVVSADVIFTEHDYGRVSDHCGYIMHFEPKYA